MDRQACIHTETGKVTAIILEAYTQGLMITIRKHTEALKYTKF